MVTQKHARKLAAVAYAAAVLASGCSPKPPSANLLLITLDTTRADRLGCYGYTNALTPALDGLAQSGSLFEDVISSVPLTLPAHATMLTGLHAPEHRLLANAIGRLSPDIPTLGEILRKRGYATAAIIASPVLKGKYGLDRGFDFYDDPDPAGGDEQQQQMGLVLYDVGDHQRLNRYRIGNEIADASIGWLQRHLADPQGGRRPFFLWAHFYDPHQPLNPHKDLFGDRFAHPYDAEIAFMDMQIARLLGFLEKNGLTDRTLVVAMGDHGQGLGDHGEDTHGLMLYDSTMRVPLLASLPGMVAAGRRVPATLPMVDLFPTMLDLLGVDPRVYPGHGDGRNAWMETAMDRSFANAARGAELSPRPAYAETFHPFIAYGWSPLQSLTTPDWKYIRTAIPELYDRRSDPAELNNLAAERPAEAAELDAELTRLAGGMTPFAAAAVQLSADDRRQLASLGYIAGGAGGLDRWRPSNFSGLPDIKNTIQLANRQWEITEAMRNGRFSDEILQLSRDLAAASPRSAVFRDELATILAGRGRVDEAIALYKQALEIDPEYFHSLNNLGVIHAQRGQIDEAIALMSRAHELQPLEDRTLFNLAAMHNQRGLKLGAREDLAGAEKDLRKAIELLPAFAEAHYNLGVAVLKQGRARDSIDSFLEALRLKPDYELAKRTLEIAREQAEE